MFIKLRNKRLLQHQEEGARQVFLACHGTKKVFMGYLFLVFLLLAPLAVRSQVVPSHRPKGNIAPPSALKQSLKDTTKGSVKVILPTVRPGTTTDSLNDTARKGEQLIPLSPNAIEDVIHYKATDSVAINLNCRQATLYKDGDINYDGMELKANEIVVDFNKQTLHAKGTVDTGGSYIGRPYFKQDASEYTADTLTFNYNTKKGIINGVITQEGDGFLHGNKVKKVNDSVMFLNSGQYTTCNYAHPHFAINFSKSKLITGNMIVTGPAYVSIEDVPTPLALPFAYFPLVKGRSSGIILPSYGWMNGRGYYLKDGGYYFAINDFMDLSLMAELYTNLSWKGEVKSNYYKRYRYKGSIDVSYGRYRQGLKQDTGSFNVYSDFKVSWQHNQDAKANPHSRFTANVNLQSRNYNKTTTNSNDYFSSTTTSSISYNTSLGSAFNLSAAFNESFNSQTGIMSLRLPTLSLSSITFYPLRGKNSSGNYKWYQNISMSYVMNAGNNLSAPDSDLLKRSIFNKMQYGISHSIPIQSSVKVLKFFNWTNSLSYNERWHWSTIEKHIDDSSQKVTIDTIRGFKANRDFSFTSALSTRLYGLFNFRLPHLKAIRHVINPSLNFNYTPDFGSAKLGYWKSYTDSTGYVHRYSIFEQSLYGGPGDGKSGKLGLSISNTLEAKVKPWRQTDSTEELRKVVLIENLTLAMSYDMAKDSLNWSDLTVNGRTTLFKNLILNYSGSYIPYVVDSTGRKHDQLLWETNNKLFQRDNSTWSAQLSWSLNNNTFKHGDHNPQQASQGQMVGPIRQSPYDYNPGLMMGTYANFNVPWNISLNYTFSYVSTYVASQYNFTSNVVQSLGISGNFSLTENWRISFSTGYDFTNKGISYTSFDIYRDLHCWEMRFNWVPFGYYKSWNFCINIKANSLKDVKWNPKKSYQDNDTYYLY